MKTEYLTELCKWIREVKGIDRIESIQLAELSKEYDEWKSREMTAKEKAEELIQEMFSFIPINDGFVESSIISAKYCALVLVKQNIEIIKQITSSNLESNIKYWKYVQNELLNIVHNVNKS